MNGIGKHTGAGIKTGQRCQPGGKNRGIPAGQRLLRAKTAPRPDFVAVTKQTGADVELIEWTLSGARAGLKNAAGVLQQIRGAYSRGRTTAAEVEKARGFYAERLAEVQELERQRARALSESRGADDDY